MLQNDEARQLAEEAEQQTRTNSSSIGEKAGELLENVVELGADVISAVPEIGSKTVEMLGDVASGAGAVMENGAELLGDILGGFGDLF